MPGTVVEPLADAHDRGAFSCGSPALDAYLRTLAGQHAKRGVSRTFVAVRPGDPRVIGYYTAAMSAVAFADLPAERRRKLPPHPVPCFLIARLAVDAGHAGLGLGSELIIDAFVRAVRLSGEIGCHAVHVHAKDAAAAAFYSRRGFEPLPAQPLHLFLPLATVRQTLAAHGLA